jgi:hypothetical protein
MIDHSKKIIAFDLDGTLAVSKQPITEEMAKQIKNLAKEKIVVIISGGSFKQFKTQFLPPFLNDSNFSSIKNIILLPTSGSQRYEFNKSKGEWEMTDFEPLSEELKQKAKKYLKEIIDSNLYDIPKGSIGEQIEDRTTQLTFSALGQEAPIEKKAIWDKDQAKRQKIKAVLDPLLPELNIIIGGTTTLDMLPKGFDKAVGLIRLLDKLGLEKSDMLFIGDAIFPGGNDYAPYIAGIDCIKTSGPAESAEIIKEWIY